jgi:hypothetical protein
MIRTAVSFVCLFVVFALISRAVLRDSSSPALEVRSANTADQHDSSRDSATSPPLPDPPREPAESTRRVVRKPSAEQPQSADSKTDPVESEVAPGSSATGEIKSTGKVKSTEKIESTGKAEAVVVAPVIVKKLQKLDVTDVRGSGTTAFRLESEPKELSATMIRRRERIRDTQAYFFVRPEDAARRSPWGVMHAIIAYGVETPLTVGGEEVNAVGWLCWNRPCRGMRLFRAPRGEIKTPIGPGFQGHEGQFLAMMAQSKVKRDFPVRIDGYDFTIEDLVEFEKRTCRPKSELTFKLIGLVHYLDSDAEWKSTTGETWNIPRLIKEELDQPIIGAACGGTHRMMGFSYAIHKRRQRGEPFTGQWERARKFVDSYIDYTFRLQNRDGSFSTDWFKGRANSDEIDRKIQTTGHMLEWLIFSLPEEDLTDPRVVRAVDFINNALWKNRHNKLEIGPKGHALRALTLYDERVFEGQPGNRKAYLADRATRVTR